MTWQRVSDDHKWLIGRGLLGLAAGIMILGLPVSPVWSQTNFWVGEGDNNLWSTPENWTRGVPVADKTIVVNGPEAAGSKGPVIEEGIRAVSGALTADFGRPKMVMNGGSLDVSRDIRWGESIEATATFEMNDGVVNVNNGKLTLGIQSSREPPRGAKGTWEMNGGELNVNEIKMSDSGRGIAEIELAGGVINVGSGGLEMSREAEIEVTDGVMFIDGDVVNLINGYINDGWITTTRDRTLLVESTGGKTRVSATNPFVPGDYNEDGVLDAIDINLQAAEMKKASPDLAKFDHNNDGEVNVGTPGTDMAKWGDRLIWIRELRNTSVGDSNLDDTFDSGDLVLVFAGGKYETGEAATWELGDWNGDMEFGSGDLVFAFSDGGYVAGAAPAAIPEPSSIVLISMALMGWVGARRRPRR